MVEFPSAESAAINKAFPVQYNNYNDPMLHLWDKGLNGGYEDGDKEEE